MLRVFLRRNFLVALTLGVVLGGVLTFSFLAPSPPYTRVERDERNAPNYKSAYRTSPETADEKLAEYTWWLTIFTAGLVVTSAVTIIFLILADNRTRQSIDLARREFTSAHRPRLRVRLFRLEDLAVGEPVIVTYEIANVGDTRARIGSVEVGFVQPQIWQRIPAIGVQRMVPLTDVIVGGEAIIARHELGFVCPPEGLLNYMEGRSEIFGQIRYFDDNGILRRTAFRRTAQEKNGKWFGTAHSNPKLEYED